MHQVTKIDDINSQHMYSLEFNGYFDDIDISSNASKAQGKACSDGYGIVKTKWFCQEDKAPKFFVPI